MEATLKTVLDGTNYPVYALSVPTDGTYPCIVYQRVSTLQVRSHQGNEIERPRFQISCWAKTYTGAKTVSEAVKTVLDLNQVNFKLATKENELDDKEVETNLYRKLLDFYVWD
jgi:hypothetical protein